MELIKTINITKKPAKSEYKNEQKKIKHKNKQN